VVGQISVSLSKDQPDWVSKVVKIDPLQTEFLTSTMGLKQSKCTWSIFARKMCLVGVV